MGSVPLEDARDLAHRIAGEQRENLLCFRGEGSGGRWWGLLRRPPRRLSPGAGQAEVPGQPGPGKIPLADEGANVIPDRSRRAPSQFAGDLPKGGGKTPGQFPSQKKSEDPPLRGSRGG